MSTNVFQLPTKGSAEEDPEKNGDENPRADEETSFSGQFGELRRLLVEPEHKKLSNLEGAIGAVQGKLDDLPNTVSEVLPAAVLKSSQKDNKLLAATRPVVEDSIRTSVKQNPGVLAEALFPVFGPAIRKAIAEALGTMVESLNKTMEYSLSPKGLRWRLEALRTGKPFAEVVLLKTLLFRVEQVFMIHGETGLLLQHVEADAVRSKDAEMVSAMLTAIQDFAKDSFSTSEKASLNALQLDDFVVWIERSPDLILAAAIRGTPPLTLKTVFEEAIEQLQFQFHEELDNFAGDETLFEGARPILSECLQYQLGEPAKKRSKIFSPFSLLAGILGLAILVAGFFYVRDWMNWRNYVSRLRNEPGIVVAETERGWFTHSISGLRDPQAIKSEDLLAEYGYESDDVISNWKEFQDLSPPFVLERAKKILNPPPNVRLSMEDDVLIADADDAVRGWFLNSKKIAGAIGGIRDFRLGFGTLRSELERMSVPFKCGTSEFATGYETAIDILVPRLEEFFVAAQGTEKNASVIVYGYASSDGSEQVNSRLRNQRADKVRSELLSKSPELVKFGDRINVAVGANRAECAVGFEVKMP